MNALLEFFTVLSVSSLLLLSAPGLLAPEKQSVPARVHLFFSTGPVVFSHPLLGSRAGLIRSTETDESMLSVG